MAVNNAYEVSLFIPVGLINVPKNLTTQDLQLYFPSEVSCIMEFYCHSKSIVLERLNREPWVLTATPPRAG
jgi:hypothetical protein